MVQFDRILLAVSLVALAGLCLPADYNNQSNWGGPCNTGKRQSPIALYSKNSQRCGVTKVRVTLWDGDTTVLPMSDQTHNINLESEFPSSILSIVDANNNLLEYSSLQYHLHSPSEHSIDGHHSDLQLHIVHKLTSIFDNSNSVAVLGFLFKNTTQVNDSSTIFSKIDFTNSLRVNFNEIFGEYVKGPIFHYQGSYTTPNCDEIVNWYVIQQVFNITSNQLNSLFDNTKRHINKPNNRSLQNLNQRQVRLISPGCNIDLPKLSYSLNAKWQQRTLLFLTGLLCLIAF